MSNRNARHVRQHRYLSMDTRPEETVSYIIFNEGIYTKAKNGTTGIIDFQGTSKLTVTQMAMNALPSGGTMFLKNIRKPNGLTHPSNIRIIEHYQGQERVYLSGGLIFNPIGTRTDTDGIVYFASDYDGYVLYLTGTVADKYYSLWTIGQVFGFGTYQWKIKLVGVVANQNHTFGLEFHHGLAAQGIIQFFVQGGVLPSYQVSTNYGGAGETTILAGQDWTVERIIKVVWTPSSVKYYIDNNLVATHSLYVPQKPMCFFMESFTGAVAPAASSFLYIKNFEEIV